MPRKPKKIKDLSLKTRVYKMKLQMVNYRRAARAAARFLFLIIDGGWIKTLPTKDVDDMTCAILDLESSLRKLS